MKRECIDCDSTHAKAVRNRGHLHCGSCVCLEADRVRIPSRPTRPVRSYCTYVVPSILGLEPSRGRPARGACHLGPRLEVTCAHFQVASWVTLASGAINPQAAFALAAFTVHTPHDESKRRGNSPTDSAAILIHAAQFCCTAKGASGSQRCRSHRFVPWAVDVSVLIHQCLGRSLCLQF